MRVFIGLCVQKLRGCFFGLQLQIAHRIQADEGCPLRQHREQHTGQAMILLNFLKKSTIGFILGTRIVDQGDGRWGQRQSLTEQLLISVLGEDWDR